MKTRKHGQQHENRERVHVAVYVRDDAQVDLLNRFVERKRSMGQDWVVTQRFVEGECGGHR